MDYDDTDGPAAQQVMDLAALAEKGWDVVYMTAAPAKAGEQSRAPLEEGMKAVVDTACTRTVAGHDWYEKYCEMMDRMGLNVHVKESLDYFKFGASHFSVSAWFAMRGHWYQVNVAIVPCKVPLLFSRPVLSQLWVAYDIRNLQIEKLAVEIGATGHPVLPVADFCGAMPPRQAAPDFAELWIPSLRAYMAESAFVTADSVAALTPPCPTGTPPRPISTQRKLHLRLTTC